MSVLEQFAIGIMARVGLDRGSLARTQKEIKSGLEKGAVDTKKTGTAAKEAAHYAGGLSGYLERIKRRATETWHTGGLGRVADDLSEVRRKAGEAREGLESVGKILAPVEGIAALGTLGGIGALLEGFARSAEIGRTAQAIGVSTGALQRWRGAAELAGLAAEDATDAMSKLARVQHAARYGAPEGALARGWARYLGIENQLYGDPEKFLVALTRQIRGQAPQVQRQILEAFGVERLLPLLQEGENAIRRYFQETERHKHLTDEEIRSAKELEEAFTGAKQATEGFGLSLAKTLNIKPLLEGYSTLVDHLKQSPALMSGVTAGVELLAVAIGFRLVGALAALATSVVAANVRILATPLGKLMLAPFLIEELTSNGLSGLIPGAPDKKILQAPGANPPAAAAGQEWWRSWLPQNWAIFNGGRNSQDHTGRHGLLERSGFTGSAPALPANVGDNETYLRSIVRQAGGNEMAQAGLLSNFWYESGGLKPGAVNPNSGATGFAQWLGPRLRRLREIGNPTDREAQGKLLLEELTGQYRPVLQRMNKARTPEESAAIGLTGFEGVNPSNSQLAGAPWPTMLRTHIERATEFYKRASGGQDKPEAQVGNQTGRERAPSDQANPADDADAGGVRWAKFPPWVKWNSKGLPYNPEIEHMPADERARMEEAYRLAKEGKLKFGGDVYSPAGGGDTSHRVQVEFNNAPAGTRTNVSEANGPAEFQLRTHFAMDGAL